MSDTRERHDASDGHDPGDRRGSGHRRDSDDRDDANEEPRTPGAAALEAAIDEHGEDVAALLDRADRVRDLVDLVVLTLAAADDDQVDAVTDSLVALVGAVDGLSTEESVVLAESVGTNADSLASALETVAELERTGILTDLAELAETASALDLDAETVRALDDLLGAAGEAGTTAGSAGPLDLLRATRDAEFRAGLGYLIAVVRALGRRRRS